MSDDEQDPKPSPGRRSEPWLASQALDMTPEETFATEIIIRNNFGVYQAGPYPNYTCSRCGLYYDDEHLLCCPFCAAKDSRTHGFRYVS